MSPCTPTPFRRVAVVTACVILVLTLLGTSACLLFDRTHHTRRTHNRAIEQFVDPEVAAAHAHRALKDAEAPVTKSLDRLESLSSGLDKNRVADMAKQLHTQARLITGASSAHRLLHTTSHLIKRETDRVQNRRLLRSPMRTDDASRVTTLLWSGGVASTYRLCDLVFVQKRRVRPVFLNAKVLDDRRSLKQERQVVRAMYKHAHDTHTDMVSDRLLYVQTITCDENRVGGFNATEPTRLNVALRALLQKALRLPRPSMVTAFDMALARLPGKCATHDTFLSTGPIEIVLTPQTPHQVHLRAVQEWGSPLQKDARAGPEAADTNAPLLCPYQVLADASSPRDSPQNLYARAYGHIRFLLACSSVTDGQPIGHHMMQEAQKHGFDDLMERTWSCRHPVHTPGELRANRARLTHVPRLTATNMLSKLRAQGGPFGERSQVSSAAAPSPPRKMHVIHNHAMPERLGWEPCYSCQSCMQRHDDGIWRSADTNDEMRNKDVERQKKTPGYPLMKMLAKLSGGPADDGDTDEDGNDDDSTDSEDS